MAKRTWGDPQVETILCSVSREEYQQILEELAGMFYEYLSQLYEIKPEVPETFIPLEEKRTGTDG